MKNHKRIIRMSCPTKNISRTITWKQLETVFRCKEHAKSVMNYLTEEGYFTYTPERLNESYWKPTKLCTVSNYEKRGSGL